METLLARQAPEMKSPGPGGRLARMNEWRRPQVRVDHKPAPPCPPGLAAAYLFARKHS